MNFSVSTSLWIPGSMYSLFLCTRNRFALLVDSLLSSREDWPLFCTYQYFTSIHTTQKGGDLWELRLRPRKIACDDQLCNRLPSGKM